MTSTLRRPRRSPFRRVRWGLLCVCLIGLPAAAQTPLPMEGAIAAALARSGLMRAAQAQVQAAHERAVAAGQRPDPVLSLGLDNLPTDGPERYSVTRDFMTMRTVGLMQELTRGDKLDARTRRAQAEVASARAAGQVRAAEVQRETAAAWLTRSYQEALREVIQAQLQQADVQARTAEALYRSGSGAQAEVYAARAAVEQLHDALAAADLEVAAARYALERWVGPGAQAPLAPRPVLALPAWAQGDLAGPLSRHPQVIAAAQQEALADSEAALARADQRPDWSVALMFSQRGPAYSNMVSVNLSVPLTWDRRNRQDRELAARLASVDDARARRLDAQQAGDAEVRSLLHTWQSHGARLQRFEATLLPLASQRSQAALTAYRAGSGALGAVLEARRGELDVQRDRLRIEAERAQVWAQLHYLLTPDSPPSHDGATLRPEITR